MPAYTVYPSRNILRLVKWQMFGQITLKAGQSFQLFFQCAVIPSADPQVSIRLPSGQRITRRFRPEDPLEQMARDLEKSRRAVKSSGEQWRAVESNGEVMFLTCPTMPCPPCLSENTGDPWSFMESFLWSQRCLRLTLTSNQMLSTT